MLHMHNDFEEIEMKLLWSMTTQDIFSMSCDDNDQSKYLGRFGTDKICIQ